MSIEVEKSTSLARIFSASQVICRCINRAWVGLGEALEGSIENKIHGLPLSPFDQIYWICDFQNRVS